MSFQYSEEFVNHSALNPNPHQPHFTQPSSNLNFSPVSMDETPSNPLYLHHVENLSAILVSQLVLGTQNYST